jgi:hypothetical protein
MELLHLIIAGLIFVIFLLSVVIYYLFDDNKFISNMAHESFENEQRLANKLENVHTALKDTNIELQRHNQEHIFNIRIRLNNGILGNNKPEHLEY